LNDSSATNQDFLGPPVREATERQIHLTFDDGPHAVNTPKLLDELKRAGVSATFFVVGKNLEKPYNKKLLRRAVAEGHQIGNHSYWHPRMTELRDSQIREEILRTEELIGDADNGIKIFRPPYGHHNPLVDRVAQELGYQLVTWTVDSMDWDPQHRHRWVDQAMSQIVTQDFNVVLAHDIHATTVASVRRLIENIRKLPGTSLVSSSAAFPIGLGQHFQARRPA
jgi:peptidoglycan/xylan/chitin deacetylase (PgdA/CDA1 family)